MTKLTTIVVLALALARVAGAQPATPNPELQARAKALYMEGLTHYNLAEYDAAITSFKEAYKLSVEPLFLFNIAQAYRLKQDCSNAAATYKSYLRNAPTAENRLKVEGWIEEMETCMAAAPHTSEPTPPVPIEPPPAMPPLVVASPARTEPAPAPTGMPRSRIAGFAALGAGVVLGGVGAYFSVQAAGHARDVETACAVRCEASAIAAIDRQGQAAERDAAILYAAGGVAIGVGVGLVVWSMISDRHDDVRVNPTSGGAIASWTVAF